MTLTSRVVVRDDLSRATLAAMGLPHDATSASEFYEAVRTAGFRGAWFRCGVFMANEGILGHPIGRLIREAAKKQGGQLFFDLPGGGMTRALERSILDGARAVRLGYVAGATPRSSFHPKVIALGVTKRGAGTYALSNRSGPGEPGSSRPLTDPGSTREFGRDLLRAWMPAQRSTS